MVIFDLLVNTIIYSVSAIFEGFPSKSVPLLMNLRPTLRLSLLEINIKSQSFETSFIIFILKQLI